MKEVGGSRTRSFHWSRAEETERVKGDEVEFGFRDCSLAGEVGRSWESVFTAAVAWDL